MTAPVSIKTLAARFTATPRRRLALVVAALLVVALAVVAAVWRGPVWADYSLEGTGLVVELPAAPEPGRAGIAGDAGPLFQMRCPELALVASGGPIPADSRPDPGSMVRQAMAYVEATPGITDLQYQVGKHSVRGQACLMVGGTFRREGTPGRLSGAFFVLPTCHGHVICFWSDAKGAQMAARIMRSLRVSPS